MSRKSSRRDLFATTALVAATISFAPAYAQDASNQPGTQSRGSQQSSTAGPDAGTPQTPVVETNANAGAQGQDIVVTGTIFRRTNSETPSPVTVISAESLARRGLDSIADAIRTVSADNSGTIPLSFTGGFAAGAAGVSLRGLTVNSTLVLFDGLRGAYYPLADDGQRNFVDINTIPNIAVERIEVLRDGASSTYGADAIGGVVNVITRKEFHGIQASAEDGVTQRGDGGEQRLTFLAGTGSLADKGWSAYIGGEYYHQDAIRNAKRGFPFNTGDLSPLNCSGAPCPDLNTGALSAGATISAVVRPANEPNPNNPLSILNTVVPGTLFQVLSPAGCAPGLTPHTTAVRGSFCEEDRVFRYGYIQPEQERIGATARITARLGGDLEGYLLGTFYQSRVNAIGGPTSIRSGSPVNTLTAVLPVFICAAGVNCATAADRRLNPNDPFAAQGFAAQINYAFGDIPNFSLTVSRTYRGAGGIHGSFGGGWNFSLDLTAMHTTLTRRVGGFPSVAGLTQAINTGAYNFVDPSQNTPATLALIAPTIDSPAKSDLMMGQATLAKELFQLPGGPLQFGVGVSARHESINSPSLNPTQAFITVNGFSAKGAHTVEAAYFELNAPILHQLEVDASGRYDHYSEGFSNFSPKIGAKFTPIRQLALRGTYSRGFRAPQFAETRGQVVGFTTYNPGNSFPSAVCTQHGGTINPATGACITNNPYILSQGLGFFTVGNPNLKPEKSESLTLGAVFQPVRWFSMTVDFYRIRKNNVISSGPLSGTALADYFAGQPLPAGYSVTLNAPDPLFPAAIQTVQIVNSPYANAASEVTSGIDITANVDLRLSPSVRLSSSVEVTDIFKFDFNPCLPASAPGCQTQHYVGTQGPYIISSGAGTPKWRGNWSTSLDMGPLTLTGTAYYTSGFFSTGEDQNGAGTGYNCATAIFDPSFCKVKRYIQVDFTGSYKVNDRFTFYMNVINAFDVKPPFDPADYAANNYNPTWSYGGIIGRFFRAGVKVNF